MSAFINFRFGRNGEKTTERISLISARTHRVITRVTWGTGHRKCWLIFGVRLFDGESNSRGVSTIYFLTVFCINKPVVLCDALNVIQTRAVLNLR